VSLERAIHLSTMSLGALRKAGALPGILSRFDCVHLGAEFCEKRFPPDSSLLQAAEFFHGQGKTVCFLTPFLSDKGLDRLSRFLDSLRSPERFELSVNDFGALRLLEKRKTRVRVNLGRVLQDNVFFWRRGRLLVQNEHALRLFEAHRIHRYEVSAVGPVFKTGPGFDPERVRVSLYYPYVNLASTRSCLLAEGPRCGRECEACAFELAHPRVRERLLMKGNTLFMKCPGRLRPPDQVRRLVYCPFL